MIFIIEEVLMSDEEIFAIGINNEYYYVKSYKEAQELLTEKTGKEISTDFVFDVFNNDKDYYI